MEQIILDHSTEESVDATINLFGFHPNFILTRNGIISNRSEAVEQFILINNVTDVEALNFEPPWSKYYTKINGIVEGIMLDYDENGVKVYEGRYRKGRKFNLITHWSLNGEREEMNFQDDRNRS